MVEQYSRRQLPSTRMRRSSAAYSSAWPFGELSCNCKPSSFSTLSHSWRFFPVPSRLLWTTPTSASRKKPHIHHTAASTFTQPRASIQQNTGTRNLLTQGTDGRSTTPHPGNLSNYYLIYCRGKSR